MFETAAVAMILIALCVVEWRYRWRSMRWGAVILALLIWWFALPDYVSAARRASVAPREARVTQLHGSPISDYESGVATMVARMSEAATARSSLRLIAFASIIWLACAPALWPGHSRSREGLHRLQAAKSTNTDGD